MSTTKDAKPFDARQFRDVLGQYPTGVSVVTATQADGKVAGLAAGSFTSVSLDPPLVAFLPDKTSTSWPKIRSVGSFCVNVLGADQESICRTFASKSPDKFAGLSWRRAGSGSPILDGAVAWIDCDLDAVYEAGDHYIVIGRVRDLDIAHPSLPLLFLHGGYGRFTPLTFTAIESDLLDQLRIVDLVRPAMEAIARDLDVECNAAVLVGDELVYVARAGSQSGGDGFPSRVGRRLPFRPPVGGPFVAWAATPAVGAWIGGLHRGVSQGEAAAWREIADRIRRQGFSLGLGHVTHAELWKTVTQFRAAASTGTGAVPNIDAAVDQLRAGYEQPELVPGQSYEVRTMSAPVFGPDGRVVLQFTLYRFPYRSNGAQIEVYSKRLLEAARAATKAVGTRPCPDGERADQRDRPARRTQWTRSPTSSPSRSAPGQKRTQRGQAGQGAAQAGDIRQTSCSAGRTKNRG